MVFFLGFVFTITFSLMVSFFFAKLLSAATTTTDEKKTTQLHHCHKFQEGITDFDSETEKKHGFEKRLQLFRAEAEKNDGKLLDEVEEGEIDVGLEKDEVGMEEKEESEIVNRHDDDDDWEGIERSDLERVFGAAVSYVGSVAMEGPCCVPQPMALMLSARAKWNAWQQLGNMSREAAMEQYINILSRTFPRWMDDTLLEDGKQDFTHNASISILSDSHLRSMWCS
ncbi:acyl-CoA-binding domain 3 [Euphorbia peplus]|nr:acyl-CoA-binding domain 3 [Euphorbia peplus]